MSLKIGAAYIRVSDERQDEYSPDSQLKLIRKYAKNNNYIIPDDYIFYDDGISAKSVKKRDAFNKMIALAKSDEKPFDSIFVWKFSRFARNQEESIVYKSLLKKKGVSVVSISEPIIDDVFGSLIERIIEWMDEYYLIRLSSEVKRGMTEKASRGEAMCHPALGYDLINKQYVPNSESIYIKQIFENYLNGMGTREIARNLGLQGVKTHRGNPPDNRLIDYILHNPVYIGKIRWSTNGRAASTRDYDNPNIMIVDGTHQPLIDMATWNKVQEMLKENKSKYQRYQRREQPVQFMLKGLVRCSSCGATLVMQSTKCPSMQCHNYARGSCKLSHSLSIAKANKAVISALETAVSTLQFNVESTENKVDSPTVDYDKLIKSEELKLKKIKEAYISGIDTIEEYQQCKAEILDTIKQLENEKTEQVSNDEKFDIEEFAKKVITVLEFITTPDVSEKEKNEALRSIISKIIYVKPENRLDVIFCQ
ncbi:MAG: recombinase family protein [Eubacterium sp.]|nr:recombinase family protein [Eubacterium sp.]